MIGSEDAFYYTMLTFSTLALLMFVMPVFLRWVKLTLVEPALQPFDPSVVWWNIAKVPGGYRVHAERDDGSTFTSYHTSKQAATAVLAMLRERTA